MLNRMEAVSIALGILVAFGFLLGGRLRVQGRKTLVSCIYVLGILWGCLLIFGQPYVRAPIRVGLGLVAVAIMGKVVISMLAREGKQKA